MYRSLQGKITSSKSRENILETSIMHPNEKQEYLQSVGHDIMRFTGVRIDLNKKIALAIPDANNLQSAKATQSKSPVQLC